MVNDRPVTIFVSYAHADLVPHPAFTLSRVGQIISDMKYELNCHSSRSHYKILRDTERLLDVSDRLHDKIETAITECDYCVVLLTENYCASEECAFEFELMTRKNKTVFLAEVEDVWHGQYENRLPYDKLLKEMDLLKAAFWGIQDNKSVRYGWPMPHRANSIQQDKYLETLEQLTTSIKSRARKLQKERGHSDQSAKHHTVFLAHPTGDVKPEADRLQAMLEADGHSVFRFDLQSRPDGEGPGLAALNEAIARCDVYVQLFGALPGRRVGDAALPLTIAQYREAEKSGCQIEIWQSPTFNLADCDVEYANFLRSLDSHLGGFEEFQTFFRKKTQEIQARRAADERRAKRQAKQETDKPVDVKGDGRAPLLPLIAIDVDRKDKDLAEKIMRAFERHVYIDTLPFDLGSEDLATAVQDNDAVILGYGQSEEGQKRIKSHWKLIQRLRVDSNIKRFELAVGDGAPPSAPPGPHGPGIFQITIRDDVDRAEMLKFLGSLGIPADQASKVG